MNNTFGIAFAMNRGAIRFVGLVGNLVVTYVTIWTASVLTNFKFIERVRLILGRAHSYDVGFRRECFEMACAQP